MTKIEKLVKKQERAKSHFNKYRSVLEDAYRYSLPERGYFDTLSNGKRNFNLYDSTAVLGVGDFANKLQDKLLPPWKKWFMLVPGSEIPEENHDQVQPQLDELVEVIYDHLNHSNFSIKVNEAFQDVAISTGILTCEESSSKESSLVFDTKSPEDVMFESGPTGIIENFFNTFKIKIADIEQHIQGAKLTPKLEQDMAKDPEAMTELVEAIVKNDDLLYDHVVYHAGYKEILLDRVDDTNPYIAFRERVSTNGVYGMGRIIQLLPDIRVLNKMAMMDLQNAGIAISGVYTATTDGVVNPYTMVLTPGSIVPVDSNSNTNPSLKPLERAGDYQYAALKIEQKQELIIKTLFGAPLGSITKTPVRSATEVDYRANENFEMANAAFSRFQTELLERLIKRIVDVLVKAGKIAPIEVDGKLVTIKFTSPLAKQQDKEDIGVVTDYANILAQTGIPMETLGKYIKYERVPGFIAENLGLPNELLRDESEQQMYDAKQAAAMQQMQQQEVQQ